MCIRVKVYGVLSDYGTHVSVYVYLMRGEYDSKLVWPFKVAITIQVVNHNNDQDHHVKTVDLKYNRVTAGETGQGTCTPLYIHTQLWPLSL